jgi:hypothetical protein
MPQAKMRYGVYLSDLRKESDELISVWRSREDAHAEAQRLNYTLTKQELRPPILRHEHLMPLYYVCVIPWEDAGAQAKRNRKHAKGKKS